jgi:hypothetical protein
MAPYGGANNSSWLSASHLAVFLILGPRRRKRLQTL